MSEDKPFFGWTKPDGTRLHDAPSNWPFATIGPVTEYGFRYAPDSTVYEKQPRTRKISVEAEDKTPEPGLSVFASLATTLSSLGDKS